MGRFVEIAVTACGMRFAALENVAAHPVLIIDSREGQGRRHRPPLRPTAPRPHHYTDEEGHRPPTALHQEKKMMHQYTRRLVHMLGESPWLARCPLRQRWRRLRPCCSTSPSTTATSPPGAGTTTSMSSLRPMSTSRQPSLRRLSFARGETTPPPNGALRIRFAETQTVYSATGSSTARAGGLEPGLPPPRDLSPHQPGRRLGRPATATFTVYIEAETRGCRCWPSRTPPTSTRARR